MSFLNYKTYHYNHRHPGRPGLQLEGKDPGPLEGHIEKEILEA